MISVVDDDPSVMRALQRLLGTSGFDVEVFHSAEEYLASEHVARTSCLVLDLHLRGLSGFELLDLLRATGRRIPFVIITARDDGLTRERAYRAGATDILRKPFEDESLIGAIDRAIGRR